MINIKTKKEIKKFKKIGRIAGKILKKILNEVRDDITTNFLNKIAIEECKKENVNPAFLNYKGYPATICASKNNIIVHGIPNDNLLSVGDVVSIDFGVEKDGFIGDVADTIIIGDKNNYSSILDACRLSLKNAISVAKSGNKLSNIGKEIFKMAIFSNCSVPLNYGGHGIDRYKLHSSPFVSNFPDYKNDMVLQPGMILAIEPMFIIGKDSSTKVKEDGWSVEANNISFHCEHTILITKNNPVVLTDF